MGAAPAEGTVLLGKLQVEQVLGEGGMGVVCRAHHLHLDQPVAIKFLLPQMVENPMVVARFLREAQAAVKLRGEHVARVIDVGRLDDGCPYMVMEYLDGADLGQILKHYGPQSPPVAADLILQACEGISEAHALGIIHRDVKPSNFFITRRPDGTPLLKILDFGISSAPTGADSELTRTQSVIGTPAYMAPEQMRSARAADPRSDLWSLGVVLYQTLAGRRPFESDAYSELCLKVGMDPPIPLAVDIEPEYTAVVMRCLEKNPDQRYQNVGELAWALVPFATDPALARGSAERASRILGIAGAAHAPQAARQIPSRMATPVSGTPIPPTPSPAHLRATAAMRSGGSSPGSNPSAPGSNPGSKPGSHPGAPLAYPGTGSHPHLPMLSQGPMAPTQLLPVDSAKATPTTASAGAGQVSSSRSMPTVAPSRSGWVIGFIAIALIGAGGWWIIQHNTSDDGSTAASGPATRPEPSPGLPPVDPSPTDTAPTDTAPTAAPTTPTDPAPATPTDPTPVDDTATKPVDDTATKPVDNTTHTTAGHTTAGSHKTGGKKTGGKKTGGKTGGKTGTGTTGTGSGTGGDDIFGPRK